MRYLYLMLRITLLFALVLESRSNNGALAVDDDDALDVFVGLHSVEGLFDFGHV